MADSIISISLERDIQVFPLHPTVERIVKKEVRQHGADYAPYTKANFQFERVMTGWRNTPILDLRLKK